MSEKSERLAKVLASANINARCVNVFGSYAHVDTYAKYEGALRDLMGNAGFTLVKISDGIHMDDMPGFRMVFRVA